MKCVHRVIWLLAASGSLMVSAALAAPREGQEASNTDWALLGGNSEMQHYSELAQINEKTIGSLSLAWYANIPTLDGLVGNPLVADGVVYQSGALARVYANDVRTGKLLWEYSPPIDYGRNRTGMWTHRFSRGVALWKDKVIVGTGDCQVIALDRKTGKVVWDVLSCDPTERVGITGAPRVGGGMVFVGNSCGDTGAQRGFIDALDAQSGARKWRFYTVPSSVEAENDTPIMREAFKSWGTDGLKKTKGCGSVWDAITYDPVLNLVYFGVDGASPWSAADRAADKGDELFTTAIVAVNADTGAYVWHYTTTPHDSWNFDATMHIMVAELKIDGKKRRVVMQAPKNGFFYVLDAKTGKLLRANNYVKVNWASHIDMKTGRPVELPDARYYAQPDRQAVVFPGPDGAHNWNAMSYHPSSGLVFIPAQQVPTLMKMLTAAETGGGGVQGATLNDMLYALHDPKYQDQLYGELVAWDPVANRVRWRARHALPINGGVLATAGNLVFQGTADGKFNAYEARTGKQVWSWQGDGAIQSAPTSVNVDGQQYLLIASGNSASTASGAYLARLAKGATIHGPSRLLAFRLGGTAALPASFPPPPFTKPTRSRPPKDLVARGRLFYEFNSCVACHGAETISAGGSVPDLRRISDATYSSLHDIVVGGMYRAKGMPMFPYLKDDTLEAIGAYLTNQAWDAYEEQESSLQK